MDRSKRRFSTQSIGLWLLLLFAFTWPTAVIAHGGGTPQLVNATAGPYHLWVWSMPEPVRLGEMHISMAIAQPAPATALDVQLVLAPTDVASQPIAQMANRQVRLFEEYYEADFMLPTAGQWHADITINGPAGVATAQFPFIVLPPHRINWTLVLWSVLAFAGLIGVIWIRRSAGLANRPD